MTVKWIPVTEHLPAPDVAVLVARHGGTIVSVDAKFDNGKWVKGEGKIQCPDCYGACWVDKL